MERPHSIEPEQPQGPEEQLGARLEAEDIQEFDDKDNLETGVEDSPGQTKEALREAAEQSKPE